MLCKFIRMCEYACVCIHVSVLLSERKSGSTQDPSLSEAGVVQAPRGWYSAEGTPSCERRVEGAVEVMVVAEEARYFV